jgi:hypothetical protein
VSLAGWLDLVVKSAAIIAGIFAIYQYLQAQQDLRVVRSLDYVERFNDFDTSIGRAHANISRTLWLNNTQILRLREILRTLPEDQAKALRARFVRKLLDDDADGEGLRGDVHTVAQFFDTLQICIRSGLCDEASAYAFFGGYVVTFWNNFSVAIVESRDLDPNYGAGLEHVLRRAMLAPGLEPPP